MEVRRPLHIYAMRPVRLIPLALLLSACSGDLERVRAVDLLEVAPSAVPQGARPTIAPGYVAEITPRQDWTVHGSLAQLGNLSDGEADTSATTPTDLGNQQWLLVDLGRSCRFHGIRQVHAEGDGFPRRYRIDTAGPKGFPWTLEYVGEGTVDVSKAIFRKPVEARFFRITVIEERQPRWGVAELELF